MLRTADWNPMTREEISAADPVEAYAGAKKFGELAVWEWAEAHPHVDVTTSKPIPPSFRLFLASDSLLHNH
jgi:nucleoside-diphosphate-sugar epimerase